MLFLSGADRNALADLVPEGYKSIHHLAVFQNVVDFSDHRFFVYPRDFPRRRLGNSSVPVPDAQPVALSGLNPGAIVNGAFLYAIPDHLLPDDGIPTEALFTDLPEGVLRAKLPDPRKTAPKSIEGDTATVYLTIGGLPHELTVTTTATEGAELLGGYSAGPGGRNSLYLLATVSMVALGGLLILVRRRNASPG